MHQEPVTLPGYLGVLGPPAPVLFLSLLKLHCPDKLCLGYGADHDAQSHSRDAWVGHKGERSPIASVESVQTVETCRIVRNLAALEISNICLLLEKGEGPMFSCC